MNLTDILNQARYIIVVFDKLNSRSFSLTHICLRSSPASSSGIPIPKASEPERVQSSSAYDMELPSLH